MRNGFLLKRLRIIGPNKPYAEIEFFKGLNVISGPSDTGKTYIFQCINFMLGATNPPKQISESEGYERIFLEIVTYKGSTYTLSRKLSGGDFFKYSCSINDVTSASSYEILKPKHNADDSKNISSFLLSLSGFKLGELIKKNKKNITRTLSFRDIARLILADEERIITESSPIISENKTNNTAEKSVFKLLITGRDDSGVTEIADPKIRKAKLEAKLELIDSLIDKVCSELIANKLAENENDLKEEVEQFKELLNVISTQIEERTNSVKTIWREIQELESRQLTINELLKRFTLLMDQYRADLQRLEFINEGNQYFTQLQYEKCPYCHQSLTVHNCDRGNQSSVFNKYEGDEITVACQIEADKINLSLKDLEETIKNLKEEHIEIEKNKLEKKIQYNNEKEILSNDLEPQSFKIKNELSTLFDKQKKYNFVVSKKEQFNDLEIEKMDIQQKLTAKQSQTPENDDKSNGITSSLMKLNEVILSLLNEWKFPEIFSVQFDQEQYDFLLSNKPRKNFGKGIRAISFSAFIIGLMKYCRAFKLPHPGFVVLDSPLTTFRDRDKQNEDVSESIQESFFLYLSNIEEQVIVLENKEPSENAKGKMNFIEFTNIPGIGREGFFIK
ncbi:AAA family ATPase [Mesobacillus subterraneus]|uniref:Rad50/SbcC-type AAA domain-containing protein n=1 Tax=Mesobacillus subterraneus TaxID=285983 RepID=A0A427TDQ6_9BACI|nr:AAA family ATPase [Mesobacillus subterraneus]RSD20622.1 hypothetical protein EJA10_22970 [Mesobacillus subterraneus]